MALGQARLTPHRHSSGASPVCSPAAASRRALHTSSRSRGCRLEDRNTVPSAPPVQKPKSPARRLRSQETGRRKSESGCTPGTTFLSEHTHRNQSWPWATDGTTVQRSTSDLTALLLSQVCCTQHTHHINQVYLFPNWK